MNQTFKNSLFNSLLVLLGFATTTSCDFIDLFACAYGTPTMDFEVSGKVVNKDSVPIAGIKVKCYNDNTGSGYATTLTSSDGSFFISGTGISPLLQFNDIDGTENGGEFADKMVEIEVDQVEEGSGSWYMGKYEAKNVVIEMEEKK